MLKQLAFMLSGLFMASQSGYAQPTAKLPNPGISDAKLLQQLPNANFSKWTQAEPDGWYTNNVYNEQGQLQQAVVVPAGANGARLLAKRVVYRTDTPIIDAWYGGQLTSALMPFMPTEGKPIALTIHYSFQPDSADVLRAEVQLQSRDNEPGTLNPDKNCFCQFKGINGPVRLSPTENSITLQATFADANSPSQVPPGCMMYVWKIKFWLENATTHPHAATKAIIEKITLQP